MKGENFLNKYTVGLFIIIVTLVQIFIIKEFKVLEMIHTDISLLEKSIDYVALLGFPILVIILGFTSMWLAKLKDYIKKQKEMVERDRNDLVELFNSIDQFIYIIDPKNNKLLFVNTHLVNYLSYIYKKSFTYSDIIGKKCHEMIQGSVKPCAFCTTNMIFSEDKEIDNKSHVLEYKNEKTDRWYRCISKSIVWKGDLCKLEYAIDITEEKRKFIEHKLSEHRLESMINALTDAYVLFEPIEDKDGNILDWELVISNTVYEELLKDKDAQIINNKRCIFPKSIQTKIFKSSEKAFRTGKIQITKLIYNKTKYSFYIYKANHGVSISIREI
jgi:PAS domain-containing protein